MTPTVLGFLSTDDLLRTVLSLYMPAENLPLPTLEEVLFCDSKTTSEEVRCQYISMKLVHEQGSMFVVVKGFRSVADPMQR